MAKTYEELLAGATQIKNNELPESNTHSLVGGQLLDMVEKQKEDSERIDNVSKSYKGYFQTLEQLKNKYPSPEDGETAWVGVPYPGNVYDVVDGTWHDSGVPAKDSGGIGTLNYTYLENKPSVNNVTLEGDKTLDELGIASKQSVENLNSKIPTVDTSLSTTSTNTVENKVIANEFNKVNQSVVSQYNRITQIQNQVNGLSGIDSPFIGFFDSPSNLPSVSSASWAIVGDLAASKPYAYYSDNIPSGFSPGWNDLSGSLGVYNFTDFGDLNRRVNNLEGRTSTGFRFTYWPPTSEPSVDYGEQTTITYESLTIWDVVSTSYFSAKNKSITIPKGDYNLVIYAERLDYTDCNLYYSYVGGNRAEEDTAYYRNINEVNYYAILGVVVNGIFTDTMKTQSMLYLGSAPSLKKNLFNKYDISLTGSVEDTFNVDVRISSVCHEKVKNIHIKGRLVYAIAAPTLNIYIDDNNATGEGRKNLYRAVMSVSWDKSFDAWIEDIPSDIWSEVDFDLGYNLFVMAYNANSENVSLFIEEAFAYDMTGEKSEYIYPKNTIGRIENIEKLISAGFEERYGRYREHDEFNNTFDPLYHYSTSVTTVDSTSKSNGYLTSLHTLISGSGTFTLKVGFIDQYPRFVSSAEYKIALSDGFNTIDLTPLEIPIKKGEQIALSTISDEKTGRVKYKLNFSNIENEMFYGENNGGWGKLATDYGGEVVLSYTVQPADSVVFAKRTETKDLEDRVDNISSSLQKSSIFYDNVGNPYKLYILDGEVKAKAAFYSKALCLGNSLTSHGIKEDIGYYGDDSWAMASTNKTTTTWTTHFENVLKEKNPSATATPFNINPWELDYMGADLDSLFSEHLSEDYDLIIFRAGENGTAGSDYSQGVDRLITYLRGKFPKADIILTDLFWHNSTKEAAYREIANKYNYSYVSFGNIADSCILGQMLLGVDDNFHPITYQGVAAHTTDCCFLKFANVLASAIGYNEIGSTHKVTISSSVKYSINQLEQVKDGYVTILTYGAAEPNISVGNGSISVSNYSLSDTAWIDTPSELPTYASVFKMPDSDVTVTIE